MSDSREQRDRAAAQRVSTPAAHTPQPDAPDPRGPDIPPVPERFPGEPPETDPNDPDRKAPIREPGRPPIPEKVAAREIPAGSGGRTFSPDSLPRSPGAPWSDATAAGDFPQVDKPGV